ncbi:MAG: TonB-dependent receptor plug domain-containing protein [Cyanophyceae cyanobacterium]
MFSSCAYSQTSRFTYSQSKEDFFYREYLVGLLPIDFTKKYQRQSVDSTLNLDDLFAQDATPAAIVAVTGVQLKSTADGLQVILETSTEQRLTPLIFPEGKTLIIDILDANLALPDSEEFRATNPAEGITEVTVAPLDATSIRITISGQEQAPTAEVVPSQQNLVLGVTPEGSIAEPEPDEEIEVVATTQAQEDYYVPDAGTATRTEAEILDIPQSIQVIPQEVIADQQAIRLEEVVTNISGVTFFGNEDGRSTDFAIRGFQNAPTLRDGFRLYDRDFQGMPEVANLERIEVLKGPASVLYGEIEPGGLINLVSKQPLSEPFYDVQLQLGNRSLVRTPLDFSGPLTADGSLSYRLNALYRHEDSFRNYDNSFERFFVAPTLAWQIGDNTDLRFNLEYIYDDDPANFGTVAFGDGVADIPPRTDYQQS